MFVHVILPGCMLGIEGIYLAVCIAAAVISKRRGIAPRWALRVTTPWAVPLVWALVTGAVFLLR